MRDSPIAHQLSPFVVQPHVIDEIDLALILADHARMREVCDELERLADLPEAFPSSGERRARADGLRAAATDHLKATSTFFSRVFRGDESRFTRHMLSHILLRQISDALYAEDVADALAEHSATLPDERLDAMLRCLFDGWRRALEFEELSLLSLGRGRLTHEARTKLEGLLERSR